MPPKILMLVYVFQDLETISVKTAEFFCDLSKEYIVRKGIFNVALSGGFTPERLYKILSTIHYRDKISWQNIHFFWVDERFVPRDHVESNFKLLHDALLSKVPVPSKNIHHIDTDASSPFVSAKEYEKELRKIFALAGNELPVFDLILLGIGEDGHTASLFPGSKVLEKKKHLVIAVINNKLDFARITLTMQVINNSENIVFLVSGKRKATAVKKVLEKSEPYLPASLVKPKRGELIFLLDKDAAALLEANKVFTTEIKED